MIKSIIACAAILMAGLFVAAPAGARQIDQSPLNAGYQNEARLDMSTKARSCKEKLGRVAGAKECFRTCASNARTLQNSVGVDAETVAGLRAECDTKYAVAQQGQAAPTPAAPDYAGRAAGMPAKAAYCRQAEARMGCPVDPSEPNWFKREQMCNTAIGCRRGCGDQGLITRLKTNPVSRDVRTLNLCEENHDAVKAWLDG